MKAALSLCAAAALLAAFPVIDAVRASTPLFPAKPSRPHTTLGPVAVLAIASRDDPAVPIMHEARARYGEVDALVDVRTMALPWGDGALVTGFAVRWD